MEGSNQLDVILEKTTNTEEITQAKRVKESISETLRLMARREKLVRQSTITIKLSNELTLKKISEVIEKEFCDKVERPSASYWQDKESAYAQFSNQSDKDYFLDWAHVNQIIFKDAIQKPNSNGEHIQRKPIRVVINNVRKAILADKVKENLVRILGGEESLGNFREGKPNPITRARAIMFNTDEAGFRTLFGCLEGAIPYINTATDTKSKLILKINCKPWACRDCFAFGPHQCTGKVCGNCGATGHPVKECKVKTKFCKNCKRRGHRAKDNHCPIFLAEVAKELRKMCIPIDYFEDRELRFNLMKHIQIN